MYYIAMLVVLLSGLSVVMNRIINAGLAERVGLLRSTLYNYISGFIVAILFMFIGGEGSSFFKIQPGSAPFWAYLGGFVGAIVIVLSSYLTPRISAFYLTLLMFVGQLFTGIVIDYFSTAQFSLPKLLGGIFVMAGLTYNLVLDNKKDATRNKS